ncbi:MAG: LCP family protein [Bacillota bacterium]
MERDNLLRRKTRVKRGRMPLNRLFFFLAFVLFIIVLIIGFRFSGAYNDLQNRADWALALRKAPLEEKGSNYLIYGVYQKEGEYYLEDIFLLNYPPGVKSPHIIFIPGEMLLNRQDDSKNDTAPPEKETFYFPVHFYEEGGAKLLIQQLSYFLSVPVHYFLGINYGGIPEMVDYRGGINYRGYVLNGNDYYDYFLQGERDEEPLQRALRRMQALGNLVEFVGEKRGIFSKSRSVRKAAPYLDTNMSWKELQEFYPTLESVFSAKGDEVISIPGMWRRQIDGEYYFEPERGLISYMMANLGKEFILPRELITVEVLNGSGVAGIAAKVAEILREQGFQVVNVGNADSFDYARSRVIARQAEIEPAKAVVDFIPGAELLKEEVKDFPTMVTVIIGKNFNLD